MKKLLCMMLGLAVGAFAYGADDGGDYGFTANEPGTGTLTYAPATDDDTAITPFTEDEVDAEKTSDKIYGTGTVGDAYTEIGSIIKDGNNKNYLKVKNSLTTPGHYTATATPDFTKNVCFDTLVRFTAGVDAEEGEYPTLGDGAKIGVWLKQTETDGDNLGETNLYVTAGFYDTEKAEYVAKAFPLTTSVKPGTWHRVTIRTINNVLDSTEKNLTGFLVYIDGQLATVPADDYDIGVDAGDLTAEAGGYVDARQLFVSAAGEAATSLTAMGFAGNGDIDDTSITWGDKVPEYAKAEVKVAITADNEALTSFDYSINGAAAVTAAPGDVITLKKKNDTLEFSNFQFATSETTGYSTDPESWDVSGFDYAAGVFTYNGGANPSIEIAVDEEAYAVAIYDGDNKFVKGFTADQAEDAIAAIDDLTAGSFKVLGEDGFEYTGKYGEMSFPAGKVTVADGVLTITPDEEAVTISEIASGAKVEVVGDADVSGTVAGKLSVSGACTVVGPVTIVDEEDEEATAELISTGTFALRSGKKVTLGENGTLTTAEAQVYEGDDSIFANEIGEKKVVQIVNETDPVTYTYKLGSNTYAIAFYAADRETQIGETQDVIAGAMPELPDDADIPVIEGKSFAGWNPAVAAATKDQNYIATYTDLTFTVTFVLDNGEPDDVKTDVKYGAVTADIAPTPTKTGYTFTGWNPALAETVTADQEYTAQWEDAKTYVAEVGGVQYETLAAAVAAAEDGATVTVLANCAGDGIMIGKNLTIDFKGFTYTVDATLVGSPGTQSQAFNLKRGFEITLKDGTITSTNARMLVQNYASLTLDNMILDGEHLSAKTGKGNDYVAYTLSNCAGDTVITGGTVIKARVLEGQDAFAFDTYYKAGKYEDATVTVNGATIDGDIELAGGSLALTAGTLNGELVKGSNIDKGTVTKADAFEAPAPADYKWVDGKLVKKVYVAQVGDNKYETLAEAITAAPAAGTVTLLADVTLDNYTLTKKITLDLNEFALTGGTSTGQHKIFTLLNGADLTVNGTNSEVTGNFYLGVNNGVNAANLTLNGGKYQQAAGVQEAVLQTNGGDTGAKVITATDCSFMSEDIAVYLAGPAETVLKDCDIVAGITGIEIRAGELEVIGTTIKATYTPTEAEANGSGSASKGAGIAVVQHTTKQDISVTVGEDTVIDAYTAFYEANPQKNADEDLAKIKIALNAGTYEYTGTAENYASVYIADADVIGAVIPGTSTAKFQTDVSAFCAAGYETVLDETDNYYKVAAIKVAKINDVYYSDLQEAFNAVEEDQTVELVATIDVGDFQGTKYTIAAVKKFTLDLAGFELKGFNEKGGAETLIDNRGNLTINDTSTDKTGAIISGGFDTTWSAGHYTINTSGPLTINGGKIVTKGMYIAYAVNTSNLVTLNEGGEIACAVDAVEPNAAIRLWPSASTKLVVNGGKITAPNGGRGIYVQQPSASDGTAVIEVNEGTIVGYTRVDCNGVNTKMTINGGTFTDSLVRGNIGSGVTLTAPIIEVKGGKFAANAFDSDSYLPQIGVAVKGGEFAVDYDTQYLAEGYEKTVVTPDTTWSAKATVYTIAYFAKDGSALDLDPKTYTVEDETFALPAVPAVEGYTPAGWTNAEGVVVAKIEKGTTGNQAFYASYTADQYTITFDEPDCVSIPYTVETKFPIELPTPADTTKGTFLGWTNAVYTTPMTELTALPDPLANIALLAAWKKGGWDPAEDPTTPASDKGIIGKLAIASFAKLSTWAQKYDIPFGEGNMDEYADAFLLDCAQNDVATEAAKLKIVSITKNGDVWEVKVTGEKGQNVEYGNGFVNIKSVKADKFPTAGDNADFFQAELVVKPVLK